MPRFRLEFSDCPDLVSRFKLHQRFPTDSCRFCLQLANQHWNLTFNLKSPTSRCIECRRDNPWWIQTDLAVSHKTTSKRVGMNTCERAIRMKQEGSVHQRCKASEWSRIDGEFESVQHDGFFVSVVCWTSQGCWFKSCVCNVNYVVLVGTIAVFAQISCTWWSLGIWIKMERQKARLVFIWKPRYA